MKLMLLTLLIAILSACTPQPDNTVPFIAYDLNDVFLQDFTEKIQSVMADDFTLEVYDSQANQLTQNSHFTKIVKENPPFIIVNPVDRLSAYTMIDLAKKHDVPLIFINREPLREDLSRYEMTFYVGADARQSARIQAELARELIEDSVYFDRIDKNNDGIVQIAILMGQQGHQDAEQRTEYVMHYLESYDLPVEFIAVRVANFSQNDAYNETKILLDDFGDGVEMILANNDAMAIGAIEALIDADYMQKEAIDIDVDDWIPVIGIDALEVAKGYIESNHMYGSVLQDIDDLSLAIHALSLAIFHNDSLGELPFEVTDSHYIWVDYQRFRLLD